MDPTDPEYGRPGEGTCGPQDTFYRHLRFDCKGESELVEPLRLAGPSRDERLRERTLRSVRRMESDSPVPIPV